jgi:transcriptional regulator with XRE-family HTH domain
MAWETRIFDLAQERGLTDADLQEGLGISRVTLWRLRNQRRAPSSQLLYAAAKLFACDPTTLFWETPPEEAVS